MRTVLSRLFLILEGWLDAIFGARWNPLYQLGALGFFYYWVVAVSGIYLYIFFDTGTTEAFDSVEYLTVEQWYLGGVMRSLHRYASDGMVLMMMVHMLREYAYGRFRGPRWFTWVTGLPIAAMVVIAGISGYWLVWDKLAQYIAVITSEWFDWLGIFGEQIARNFMAPESLDDRLFTLMMFIHIMVPLFLLLVLWIHLLRISRPQINPNRGLAVGTFVMLIVLSLVKPAVSHEIADLSQVPTVLNLDWYYLAIYPLMEIWSYGGVWALLVVAFIVLAALPWLPPRWKAKPAVVHLQSCNGCQRCADDCPYEAILMRPRSDGQPFTTEAVINPDLCTSCGICAGSCPTATPFRRRSELVPGIELQEDLSIASLRQRLEAAAEQATQTAASDGGAKPRILVMGCTHGLPEKALAAQGISTLTQPCVAGIPPSFIDFALSRDLADGLVISGCREGDCAYRFGNSWMAQRIAGKRDPYLRKRVPRERLRAISVGPGDTRKIVAAVQELAQDILEEQKVAEFDQTEAKMTEKPTSNGQERVESHG